MLFRKRFSSRGSVPVLSVLLMALGVLTVGRFAMISFHKSEIEHAISTMLLQNRNAEDPAVRKEIFDYLKGTGVTLLSAEQIRVFRTSDRDRILLRFTYTEPMRLPYLDIGFDREVEVIVEELLRVS